MSYGYPQAGVGDANIPDPYTPPDGTFNITGSLAVSQVIATSGSPTALLVTGAAHTTLAASTEAIDVNFNLARTVQFATGALATQRAVRFQAPTYGFVAASTISDAATVEISGAPVAGTNATITRGAALWAQGNVRVGAGLATPAVASTTYLLVQGTGINQVGVRNTSISVEASILVEGDAGTASVGTRTNNQFQLAVNNTDRWRVETSGNFTAVVATYRILSGNGTALLPAYAFGGGSTTGLFTTAAQNYIGFATDGVERARVTSLGNWTFTQGVSSSGSPTLFGLTGAAHTTLAASTEAIDVNLNLARTVQFATGALTTQRAVDISAPTYGFVGASTLTTAVTVDIAEAPAAGTNATITADYALRVGGAVTAGPTSAGALYAAINVPAHTVTYTGTTQVTSAGPAALSLGIVTVTDTSAVTINTGATLYIAGAPAAAGSVTLTSPYSIWVDAGASRFDGAVGIGAASPVSYLYVQGPTELTSQVRVDSPSGAVQTILGSLDASGYIGTLSNHEIGIRTNNAVRLTISAGGNFAFTQGVATSGSPTAFTLTGAAHTTLAASTEAIDVNLNLARTVQFATGALTTQRAFVVQAPTYAFVGASTLTTAVTADISGAPAAGTSATITADYALRVGGAVTAGPTSAGALYAAINVPAHTVTYTGTTQVTSAGPAAVSLGIVTVTDTSAVTINTGATLYIAGAPAAAGSVTITNAYSLWVDAGNVRTDGQILAANGTISAPSYSFQSETGTGWYAASSTDIRLALAGTDYIRCESSLIAIYTTAVICTTLRPGNTAGVGTETDLQMVSGRALILAGSVQTSGSAANSFVITAAAHTGLTASTEVVDVNFNLGRTVQHATGALTTQRAFVVQAPTYGFVGASTITTAVTVDISAAPAAGTNATITNTYALRVGGAVAAGASAAGSLYAAINVPAHTVTYTGTTQVTSAGPAAVSLGIVTVTDTSAVTIDTAATLYIAGAPAQAGSVTITNSYSIWVDAGPVRFDAALTVGTTLTVTGTTTPTGGILPTGGATFTASRFTLPVGGRTPSATAPTEDGTNSTPVAGTVYYAALYIPCNYTITGVGYLIGLTGGTDSVIVALYNSAGTLVANSDTAGTLVGAASTIQQVAFTATYAAPGPGLYYVSISFNGITARYRAFDAAMARAGSATGTFGTLAAITPPTAAAAFPIMYIY